MEPMDNLSEQIFDTGMEVAPAEASRFKGRVNIGQYDSGSNMFFKGATQAFGLFDADDILG
jgi:hypothetical protein